jgi:hypothetical protein
VETRLVDAVARLTTRRVVALDPNRRLTSGLLADAAFFEGGAPEGAVPGESDRGVVAVELVSKVALTEAARAGIARLVAPLSPATAAALLSYAHVPDLF